MDCPHKTAVYLHGQCLALCLQYQAASKVLHWQFPNFFLETLDHCVTIVNLDVCVFVPAMSGVTEHGAQYQLRSLYEHKLQRTAFNFCWGPFGGVKGTVY